MLLDPIRWTADDLFTVNGHGFQFVDHHTLPDPPTGRFDVYKWREMLEDPTTKIGRPRQVYVGETERTYVGMGARSAT